MPSKAFSSSPGLQNDLNLQTQSGTITGCNRDVNIRRHPFQQLASWIDHKLDDFIRRRQAVGGKKKATLKHSLRVFVLCVFVSEKRKSRFKSWAGSVKGRLRAMSRTTFLFKDCSNLFSSTPASGAAFAKVLCRHLMFFLRWESSSFGETTYNRATCAYWSFEISKWNVVWWN